MVLTTLPLRPRKTPEKSTGESFLFRSIGLGLMVIWLPFLSGCGSGGGTNDASGGTSSPSGSATASLAWDPVADPSVYGYYVHYGRQSPHSHGSCQYPEIAYTSSPSATITGLAPNTDYFFAVSATNGMLSACSNEVSHHTPAT